MARGVELLLGNNTSSLPSAKVAGEKGNEQRVLRERCNTRVSGCIVRPSVSLMPGGRSLRRKMMFPMGFVVQPLASPMEEIDVVDIGTAGAIERCTSCRAYLNPSVHWEDCGRLWVCNFCGCRHPMTSNGLQDLDQFIRPMPSSGTVEYIVRDDPLVHPPTCTALIFVIEVSQSAVASGFLNVVAASIKHIIESGELHDGPQRRIGVITFDSSVHFYDLNPKLRQPQMHVMPDLEEPFQPLSSVLFSCPESECLLALLMDSLPQAFAHTKINTSCLGTAVNAAAEAAANTCAKIVVCARSLPSIGELSLAPSRCRSRHPVSEGECDLLTPANDEYAKLGAKLANEYTTVDLFVAPQSFMDLASMAPLATCTAGEIRLYREFQAQLDGPKLVRDMLHSVRSCMAWQARMEVHVSAGWVVSRIFGNGCISGSSIAMPSCHADQNFGVLVDIEEGAPPPGRVFHIQSAISYTNSHFERHLRVHTYTIHTSTVFADIMSSVDPKVVATLLMHAVMERALATNIQLARGELMTVARHVASAHKVTGQEPLRSVILYIMGMLKSRAFSTEGGANAVFVDERVERWAWLVAVSTDRKIANFCPLLLALPRPDESSDNVVVASSLRLSSESLSQEHLYLLEDGQSITLWIGSAVSSEVLRELFGVTTGALHSCVVDLDLWAPSTPFAARIASLVRQVCSDRFLPSTEISIIFSGDPVEQLRFRESLIEDKTQVMQTTYAEFLQSLSSTL